MNFGWEAGRSGPGPAPSGEAPAFVIDNKRFSGDYDQEMVLGAVEEWTLTNSTAFIAHPFHIHVNPFQVVEIFDPTTGKTYKPDANHVWQDTIAIPPATFDNKGVLTAPGRVTIRHRFVDFVGSYVLHCHMLAHADRGMIQLVRVVPSPADLARRDQPVPQHH